jgi:hypothetical protein
VVFTVTALSRRATRLGAKLTADDAKAAIAATRCDGGTDLSLLTRVLAEASEAACEAAVLLSDGLSNLGAKQLPDLSTNQATGATPVHIPMPPPVRSP